MWRSDKERKRMPETKLTHRDIYRVILKVQDAMMTNLKVKAKARKKKRWRMKKSREKTKERPKSCKTLKKPNKFKTETNRKYREVVVLALSA